jgi:predicted DNA-binding protein (UPF0278 family)
MRKSLDADRLARPEVEAAAHALIEQARSIARETSLSPFEMPEVLLLAAVEMAAQIDGTAEGTIEWIQNVAARLRETGT